MIDSINASSRHLWTGNGSSNIGPYISSNDSVPMHGVVRYINQQFQAYNGGGWLNIPGGSAPIGMNSSAEQAIDWAIKKMEEERRVTELAKTNPTIADALDAVKHAQEQLDIVLALTE